MSDTLEPAPSNVGNGQVVTGQFFGLSEPMGDALGHFRVSTRHWANGKPNRGTGRDALISCIVAAMQCYLHPNSK